jgi:hypothetical protein
MRRRPRGLSDLSDKYDILRYMNRFFDILADVRVMPLMRARSERKWGRIVALPGDIIPH